MAASTFSYAQAAKGLSTPVASSKPTSGTATPAKDAPSVAANGSSGSVQSWADDAETETVIEQSKTSRETQQQATTKPAQSAQPVEASDVSSPDLGASSASTVTKDDDVSSLPNASSESTWDNKSQASTSVDKSVEPVEKTSEKVKKGKNAVVKPLQEAPLPAVNIWKQRAEELKSKVQKPESASTNGPTPASLNKKSDADTKGRSNAVDSRSKGHEDHRNTHGRKDGRAEADTRSKGKHSDKDVKLAANNLPPPPARDQESWPTPEIVVDEDRKKAQEKVEKERKESTSAASHGKQEWVKVPYTPTVVFSTPLPNAAGSRRGGRPGGRGGSQPGGRPAAGPATNGAGQSEKDVTSTSTAPNGEQNKRDRVEGSAPREVSPRSRRAGGAPSPILKNAATSSEKTFQKTEMPASEASAKISNGADHAHTSSQNGGFTRPYPSRSNKPRRGDFVNGGERKRDGEVSPSKDNTFEDRRAAATTQMDAHGDGERRASTHHDGPNGHHKQGRFGSYPSGRDRPRGGNRGGRGAYSNGHQYTNGHVPALQNSTFPIGPRSPTSFNPENPSFFSAPQGKYGRNGHRSQSVTSDAYRFAPYQNGAQVPAMQGYGMYDYNMMPQPMSAVPYSPYVDHFALFAMIATQVEYYFSFNNLLKDMFLRRHMDSQGFVTLEFIAGFNRIKNLSTDIELIKLVCQQSAAIEYRIGEDGQDRLRRREGWEQWVLNMSDRDESAQNEGPKELRHPPIPQVNGFDQANPSQWPMSAMATTFGNDNSYHQINGYPNVVGQDNTYVPESMPESAATEVSQDVAVTNGHAVEPSIKTVSLAPDPLPLPGMSLSESNAILGHQS